MPPSTRPPKVTQARLPTPAPGVQPHAPTQHASSVPPVQDTPSSGSPQLAAAVPAFEDPYLGKVIADRYKILSKLGEGGMGVVYLAEHVVIEKKVALKILSEDLARKGDLVARFMQEAKAASKIGHENIIDITDFGETPSGSVFFAMEFLDGADLAHYVREQGAMPFARVRHVMNQVCRALGAAHSKGIIHRDLKPENIYLIEREGTADFVKILDFGIAKISSFDEGGGARLTRTGMIFGTPEYMSPEQAKGDRPDHRVDIYAAGCILYELLTGDVPFSAETFMGVLTKHMFEPVEPPSVRLPSAQISPDVEAVVMKALAKDREQRFQTMKEMALAIEACAGGDLSQAWGAEGSGIGVVMPRETSTRRAANPAPTPMPTPVPAQRGSSWPLVVGATLALGALAGGAFVTRGLWMPAPVVVTPPKPLVETPVVVTKPVVESKPALPPAATSHKLTINSTPSGAEVFRDLERLGSTPTTITLAAGTDRVGLVLRRRGYKDFATTVVPDHDGVYDMPLQPLAHKAGPSKAAESVAHPPATKKPPETKPEPAESNGKLRDLKNPFPGG